MRIGIGIPSIGQGVSESVPPDPPSFLSVSTNSAASFSVSVTKPASVTVGDILIAFVSCDGLGEGVDVDSHIVLADLAFGGAYGALFYRIINGTEPASFNATDPNLSATAIRCTIVAYRPAPGTSFSAPTIFNLVNDIFGTDKTVSTIEVINENSMIVVGAMTASGRSFTAPAGMTERSDASANRTVAEFDVVQAVSEAVSKTAVIDVATNTIMGIVAITPT